MKAVINLKQMEQNISLWLLYLAEEQLKSRIEQIIHELDTNFNIHTKI
jgi:hypothetical protein